MIRKIHFILLFYYSLSFGNESKGKNVLDITDKSEKDNSFQSNEYDRKNENFPGQHYYGKNEKYDEEYVGNPGKINV